VAHQDVKESSVGADVTVAVIEMLTGMVPVVAWYFYTHPAELNITKRYIARYLYQKCERITVYWWDKAIDCAIYYDRLRP
jgi:hypothetical protein